MPRGGRRPGAGRPKGLGNTQRLLVDVELPALASHADMLAAALSAPAVVELLARSHGSGTLVPHQVEVEVGLTRPPRITVRMPSSPRGGVSSGKVGSTPCRAR